MNYLNPEDAISISAWNDLFAAADEKLTTMLGGLSAVFASCSTFVSYDYADKQWDRGFFFGFDPVNPPFTLHPLALQFVKNYLLPIQTYEQQMFLRQYDHAAITSQLAGLTQLSTSTKWNVVKLALPTWASWSAGIYPSGVDSSWLTQTINTVVYPVHNCLDVSLQVHTAMVSGTPFNVTFDTVLDAEHAQPLKGIDVFLLGDVTWDTTNWNKYSIVRAHNCGQTTATIFGTAILSGRCRCFRKIGGTWTAQGNYFHWMLAGDGRFLQMRETGNPANRQQTAGAPSIFMPGIVTDVLLHVLNGYGSWPQPAAGNFGMQPDLTRFYDLKPVYNNPAYLPVAANENTPPVNGYFPAPSAATLIGDLIIPRGKFLVSHRTVPQVVHATLSETVMMTVLVPAPTYNLTDGANIVANPSNAAVYNLTTGQSIPMQSNPSDITTTNWQVNYSTMQISIIPRGSFWNGTAWAAISPAPYAPFISQGDLLQITFDYIPPDDHVWVNFDSFGTLAANLAAAGLASRALSESNPLVAGATLNNLEIYSTAAWHIIDLSSPLVTFLTTASGALPAITVGSTQSSSPPSLKLPWLIFTASTVINAPTSTTLNYYNWSSDANGNPIRGTLVNVSLNQGGSTASINSAVLLPTDSISSLQSWITGTSEAGGILKIQNFNFFSTTFGHIMTWEEIWPLDARFTALVGLRTVSVVYEPGIGLHVTRALYLNGTKYGANYSNGQGFDHGIFPPIGDASLYLFWHYARVDRQFQNSRWYQHLSADTPWMPNPGYTNSKFPPFAFQGYSDELSQNEFNSVISFYETTPIGEDTIGNSVVRSKSGISRMGSFSRSPDIWSPFSSWLQKNAVLNYPNGSTTGSIATGSGWYYLNTGNLMANATISNPIPSALPLQMEHFNAIASLVNGIPPFKWIATAPDLIVSTAYTLNFAVANVIIVSGGDGYRLGEKLSFNLQVSTISPTGSATMWYDGDYSWPTAPANAVRTYDGSGTTYVYPVGIITGVTQQSSSFVVNSYDVRETPPRPFTLGGEPVPSGGQVWAGPSFGTNATCDTTVGDGSALSFIPLHRNISIPTLPALPGNSGADFTARMTDSYFPRESYYSWNGPAPGAADPITDYFTTLGIPVQTSLFDNFGAALPIYEFDLHSDGTVTNNRVSSYAYGCTPAFQTQVNTYRWIKIDDVRTLYAKLSLPFVLNDIVVPFSWRVFNVTGSNNQTVTISPGTSNPMSPPTPDNGGGDLGPVNAIQADFFNDVSGNFVRPYRNENVCASTSPIAGPKRFWINQTSFDLVGTACYNYDSVGNYTSKTVESFTTFSIPPEFAPAGFTPMAAIVNFPQRLSSGLFAILCHFENIADQCVICAPQNVAYYDEPWITINLNAVFNLGTQVIPIVADNSVEISMADVTCIPGTGGVGQYETLLSTALLFARLVTVPVDGQIQNNPPPPGGGI